MLKWLKGLFAGPPGFDTLPALGRCRPIRVRPYTDADFDVCLGIYKRNEPGRFPEKYIDRFIKVLRDHTSLMLLAEDQDRVVGFGGVNVGGPSSENLAWLSFGMVEPALHRQGYGTTILLARLAALPEPPVAYVLGIGTAGSSDSFYERFGFHTQLVGLPEDSEFKFNFFQVVFAREHWRLCRTILKKAGTTLDLGNAVVPENVRE